ncbi:unnamed protein product, partial [Ranitomeya imitator]
CGRKRKIDKRFQRKIVRMLDKDPRLTSKQVQAALQSEGTTVSTHTIRLNEKGLYGVIYTVLGTELMSPLAQMEEERREHVAKMKKMEMEMEQVFEMKVKEKVQKLKDSEAELQRRHEQMKKNLEAQHKELEEKRRQFEEEKINWETQQRLLEQQNSSRTLEKNKKKGKIF